MPAIFRHRITLIWLGLMVATAVSWEFGHGLGFGERHDYATVSVLLIALLKVRFVMLDFMELRTAPLALRAALEAWALIVIGTLIALYWGVG